MYYDDLPESTKSRIVHQFGEMAGEKSYRTTVARKWNEEKSKQMPYWFKELN